MGNCIVDNLDSQIEVEIFNDIPYMHTAFPCLNSEETIIFKKYSQINVVAVIITLKN